MPRYLVTFENTGSSTLGSDSDPIEHELSSNELDGYSSTRTTEGTFPDGVIKVVDAHTAPDDSVYPNGRDEDGDIKLFVSIGVVMEFESGDDADDASPPVEMLEKITDMLGEDLSTDGDWEVLEAIPYTPYVIASTGPVEQYWSTEDGWVARERATEYSDSEHRRVELPVDGRWLLDEPTPEARSPKL